MKNNEPKNERDQRVSEMLDLAANSSVAIAARSFREAGFEVELGRIYTESEQPHRGIELIARTRRRTRSWTLEASWHVAHAPGNDGVLVVLNETSEDQEDKTAGFQPLANDLFDRLLHKAKGRYTGIGLLDAPKVRADGLLEVLGVRGVGGKDYQAMVRALDSSLHALHPSVDFIVDPRPTFRFAVPLLVTEAEMYEACATVRTAKMTETCYIALEHQHRGTRSVDVVGLEFIGTYIRMAAEAVDALPRLIGEQLDHIEQEPRRRSATQIDAWEQFRNL